MPKTRVQKEETVQKLTDSLSQAKSVVFADYQQAGTSGSKGLNMSQLTELRQKLAEVGGKLTVTKNNLLKLALQKVYPNSSLLTQDSSLFQGPVATLVATDDEISPIKVLVKSLKEYQIGTVKAGILEGEVLDQFKINQLAGLPTKNELRAQVVGSLGAPLYEIVGVLQANLRNLVYALDQIRISRGGE